MSSYVEKDSNGKPTRPRYGKRVFYQIDGAWREDRSARDNIKEVG